MEPVQPERVLLGDRIPPWQMADFYDSVDCVLLLSGGESQCRVAMEAMWL
jgi:hypothetical protein